MRTALITGLLTLLTLARCEAKAAGEKRGYDSRTVDADSTKLFDLRDQPQELQQKQGNCPLDTDCIAAGGICFRDVNADTPDCDFTIDDRILCGSSCQCCISCSENNCDDSGDGTCRTDCDEGEFTRGNCGTSPCKCCEPCEAATCDGHCVGDPNSCNPDEYVEGDCGFGSCSCCLTCEEDSNCEAAGGVCVNVNTQCDSGLLSNNYAGCNDDSCKCCSQCDTSSACAEGANPGRCVTDSTTCDTSNNEYTTNDSCGAGTSCMCCKTCQPDSLCSCQGGECFSNGANGGSCPTDYIMAPCGGCNASDCICCIADIG